MAETLADDEPPLFDELLKTCQEKFKIEEGNHDDKSSDRIAILHDTTQKLREAIGDEAPED